ncbi:hypothetical protein EMMF5_000682 [Cystobasidiomycetes sp. EMM_F5]
MPAVSAAEVVHHHGVNGTETRTRMDIVAEMDIEAGVAATWTATAKVMVDDMAMGTAERAAHTDVVTMDDGEVLNAGRSQQPLPSQTAALAEAGVPSGSRDRRGKDRSPSPSAEAIEASKPNFKNSGALAAETNTFKGVVLKYNEPPEARKPNKGWRLYVFKGKEQVDMVQINRQSAYLFGRDRTVVDIHIEHPSSSKQHAVLQFRSIQERSEFGETKNITKPYIIDLESANGTTVNGTAIPPSRYYEIQANDVIQFAFSTREYVVIVD